MSDESDELSLEDFKAEQRVSELQKALNNTLRRLEKEKLRTGELVEAVFAAASDAAAALDIPPVPKPTPDRRRKGEEVAVAVLADWQLAKVTSTYDSGVCEERVDLYADKVMELTDIQRADHPVKSLHVWALGDLIEGEMIFPGQSHLIDASLYRQITVDGPRILSTFLRRMAGHFDEIQVHAVIGNHGAIGGRARREHDPETNGDRMLYRICQQILANQPNLTWNIPEGLGQRNWYAIDDIGGYRTLLIHGDQIRGGGFGGFPFYGLAKKVWGWKSGGIKEPFDDVFLGHWHQPTRVTLNDVTARVSGSTESHNDYAAEQLAAAGRPSQWLGFVKPGRGITAEYTVWLDSVGVR